MNKEVKTANMQDDSAIVIHPKEEELTDQDLDAVSGGIRKNKSMK